MTGELIANKILWGMILAAELVLGYKMFGVARKNWQDYQTLKSANDDMAKAYHITAILYTMLAAEGVILVLLGLLGLILR